MVRRFPTQPAAGGRRRWPRWRSAVTPLGALSAAAIVGSIVFLVYGLVERGSTQIPVLTAGLVVLGLTFATLAVSGAIGAYRSARAGLSRRAFLTALGGGIAALIAAGVFAAAAVLALLWRSA